MKMIYFSFARFLTINSSFRRGVNKVGSARYEFLFDKVFISCCDFVVDLKTSKIIKTIDHRPSPDGLV